MSSFRYIYSVIAVGLVLSGCAVSRRENLYEAVNWNTDHIKMAVRPSYRSIAVLPFFNKSGSQSASTFARRSFYGKLAASKDYTLPPLSRTDAILKTLPRKAIDPKEFAALFQALQTDLLCFGEVLEQSHSYGFFFSYNKVTARVILVDARTGQTVWESNDSRSKSLVGLSFISIYENEAMWAREVCNRYDELFRDMMAVLPNRSVE